MKTYNVLFSKTAREDMQALFDYITYTYKSYKTADDYQLGLLNAINELRKSAEVYNTMKGKYAILYGGNIRRINYKKMAILYSVNSHNVLIRRIIASSLIILT